LARRTAIAAESQGRISPPTQYLATFEATASCAKSDEIKQARRIFLRAFSACILTHAVIYTDFTVQTAEATHCLINPDSLMAQHLHAALRLRLCSSI
jgi:hypothetical protein